VWQETVVACFSVLSLERQENHKNLIQNISWIRAPVHVVSMTGKPVLFTSAGRIQAQRMQLRDSVLVSSSGDERR
jgi:hypothetical protein